MNLMGGMEQMVESHAYRAEPYVDGRHSGSLALIRGVGKLSGIHFIEDSSDLCKIFNTLYPQNGM